MEGENGPEDDYVDDGLIGIDRELLEEADQPRRAAEEDAALPDPGLTDAEQKALAEALPSLPADEVGEPVESQAEQAERLKLEAYQAKQRQILMDADNVLGKKPPIKPKNPD